ncbi:MAG: SDR family NAD(P)-dependent oxidoreductase [Candidatus Kapabacteria bacterium]|nr:SDR family NAD(P)-dependent oxidoreductase [Candidatus Kapabacteria bacterium]
MALNDNPVVVITGASSGIGAALAVECAAMNARLAICARRTDDLHDVAAKARDAGAEVYAAKVDVTKHDDVEEFIMETLEKYGRIDVLVNNAGRGNYGSVEDTSQEQLDSMFALNVFSLWYATGAVLPIMKRQGSGHIMTVASVAGKLGFPFNSAYVAAKHAAVGFMASLRAELVDTGIHATTVCPDGVITEWGNATEGAPIGDLFMRGIRHSRTISRERNIPLAPLKKMLSAQEVAAQIVGWMKRPPASDVYTHDGSEADVLLSARNRAEYEQQMLPLFAGMKKAYYEE